MPALEDTDLVIVGALAFATMFFYGLGERLDNVALLIPSGIIAMLMAFEVWTLTANLSATLAIAVLGIAILAIGVRRLYDASS